MSVHVLHFALLNCILPTFVASIDSPAQFNRSFSETFSIFTLTLRFYVFRTLDVKHGAQCKQGIPERVTMLIMAFKALDWSPSPLVRMRREHARKLYSPDEPKSEWTGEFLVDVLSA